MLLLNRAVAKANFDLLGNIISLVHINGAVRRAARVRLDQGTVI
jgi:hypothetical protein